MIPARASLTVDTRAPDRDRLDALLGAIPEAELRRTDPVPMAAGATDALRRELEGLGLPAVELASGAGHDAGVLAGAGVPAAMLFVRSLAGGVSHSPDERTAEEDVALCVQALAGALRTLAAA